MDIATYIIIFFTFAIHAYLCLFLAKRCLIKEQFHPIVLYIFCVLNAFCAPTLIEYLGRNSALAYLVVSVMLVIEVIIIFHDKLLAKIGVAFGLLIHFFTCRSIVLGAHALMSGDSMYTILRTPDLLIIDTLMVMWVHIIVLILFITLVPPKAVKSIIANKTLLHYIAYLMIVLGIFFIYNARIFAIDTDAFELALQQILLPLVLLGLFYFILIFMLKLVMLDTYQKVIAELENKIDKDQMLSNALFNYADIVVEFNASKNQVLRFVVNSAEIPVEENLQYSDFLKNKVAPILHEDHLELLEIIANKNVIAELAQGKNEIRHEYQAKSVTPSPNDAKQLIHSEDYQWHELFVTSKTDEESQDVISICTIDNIHEDKSSELALLSKTELDSLTGAYNKEGIKNKVTSHLETAATGTLFIFDIDNFKDINDNLGHTYGDEVLCDIYTKISTIFRSEDLIGRFGGDEFVAFIHNDTSILELERIGQRICDSVKNTYRSYTGASVDISTSIGIASAPADGTTYDELFVAADLALYASKNRGKNSFTLYNKSLRSFHSQ